jgi:hypothetical protein
MTQNMAQSNYKLLRKLLDHEEPERIPSFHLGYASQVLEQALLEYREPQDADVCLYNNEGPAPRHGIIDLTIDHLLNYTGHYHGEGPKQTKSIGQHYLADREDLPLEKRFLKTDDQKTMLKEAKKEHIWSVGFFGSCHATRAKANPNDEGFTSYYVDGLLTPENIDEFLAANEYQPQEPHHYQFLGRFCRDLQTKYPDWSFPVIGGHGLTDSVIMALKGNFGAFARWARKKPTFIDKVANAMFTVIRDCCYLPLLEAGVPIIYWGEDLGQKERLLLSVDQHKQFFAKYLKELMKLVHSYDAKLIMHSDGNVAEVIPTLIDCGIDGLQALEPASGMKLGELTQKYGHKLAFFGALDQRVLCWGSTQDTIKMVKQNIKDGVNGGGLFALGPSHQPIGAKAENMFAMAETIKKYGTYPINTANI